MTFMMMMIMILTPFMKHPISLGFLLILQTTLISMNMYINLKSTWYSYILFITIIGGMMVMFMYMTSISSNEKFEMMNSNMLIMISILIIVIMCTICMMKKMNMLNEMSMKLEEKKMIFQVFQETKSTHKLFKFNKNMITIFLMMILLLTMISVTNISSSFEGPLKKT
uniref:NADH dehydrogenase subunit 6 n=1 Tax=Symplanella nigricans TaxID=2886253 RepID=UPI001E6B3267|nr:NADH dehydrogenase subunit 6 [Symplanella nigricans]UDL71990.1 NADH dehydrogenase subunit 6 [Symplanella nigricans]